MNQSVKRVMMRHILYTLTINMIHLFILHKEVKECIYLTNIFKPRRKYDDGNREIIRLASTST